MNFLLVFIFVATIVCVHTHEDHNHVISESEHYKKESEHNTDYDHDAFLGKGHGHDFDSLEPEEAKRRLAILIKKVDKNSDAFVEYDELQKWINLQRTAHMWDTIDMIIRRDDDDKNGEISWPEYKRAHYGQWDDEASIDPKLKAKIDKAKHKFEIADVNKDDELSRDEYVYFRHPEESSNKLLQEIAVDEVIDEMDQDANKNIDLDEFLGQYVDDDKDEPPSWIIDDRKHFADQLDHDKSGLLERAEMRAWVLPNKNDTIVEANHLIKDADDSGDGKLSTKEILDHYHLFVGSTATDHGRALREDL